MLLAACFSAHAAYASASVTASRLLRDNPLRSNPLRDNTLRDFPLASASPPQYLDGSDWMLSSMPSQHGSDQFLKIAPGIEAVPATVPGDLVTDLQKAGVIGDPYYNNSFQNASLEWNSPKLAWRYEKQFITANFSASVTTLLVFDGVKMASRITLNGKLVGHTSSQYMRYSFDVTEHLQRQAASGGRASVHRLFVDFEGGSGTLGSDLPDDEGRFMACSGGWDWAPLSPTRNSRGTPTFSKGIWKSVYLTQVQQGAVAINHLSPQVLYHGPHATTRLDDGGTNFSVLVRVEVWAPSAVSGVVLKVEGSWGKQGETIHHEFAVPPIPARTPTVLNASILAVGPRLWWPLGMGAHTLHTVTATIGAARTSRSIGFRSVALITTNDTGVGTGLGTGTDEEGSGNFTMFFRVNGLPMFARGANFVPMEELEGRVTTEATVRLVRSAAEGNMNMLRIWGGGVYQYRAFYEECDAQGVLVYHDMMYIEQGHGPCCPYYACASGWSCANHTYNATCSCDGAAGMAQHAEIAHQIRRLASHPSIIVWDACNECGGFGRYQDFVMTTVVEEDLSRPVWPSSPSPGWAHGVYRLTGLPIRGGTLVASPGRDWTKGQQNCSAPCTACQCTLCGCDGIESHGPYVGDRPSFYNIGMAPNFTRYSGHFSKDLSPGISQPGHFTSEFGCTGLSSFESMSSSLPEEDWSVESAPMKLRNHPPQNQIEYWFGKQDLQAVGKVAFQRQLYQHMMGQAWWIKTMMENTRRVNEWGMLFWMFNEIWPTSGWGSLEYGTAHSSGQVIGGRWKPLHYLLESSTFRDVICACDVEGKCYVRNDGVKVYDGHVSVTLQRFEDGKQTIVRNKMPAKLAAGPAAVLEFCIASDSLPCPSLASILKAHGCEYRGADCMLVVETSPAKTEIAGGSTENAMESTLSWGGMRNEIFFVFPSNMTLPAVTVSATVTVNAQNVASSELASVTLKANGGMAVAVVLTTASAGRFAKNVFSISPDAEETVQFTPWSEAGPFDPHQFQNSLRVEHLQQNLGR